MSSTDFDERLERCKEQIRENEEISQENTEWALNQFKNFLATSGNGRGNSRKFRYMSDLKTMMKYNNFSFHDWKEDKETKKKVRTLLAQIEESDYKNGKKPYAPKTKQSYNHTVKRVIESHDIDPDSTKLLPKKWKPNTSKTEASDIRPDDLPNPEQMKKLLRGIESKSDSTVQLRNVAFILFLWDTGARFGEADEVTMDSVHVDRKQVKVEIPGNKQSNDRPDLEIFQGRKTLKDWIMEHPDRDNSNARLFPSTRDSEKGLPYNSLKRTIIKARTSKNLDFTIEGQPFHIFRKANTTFYVVNDILSAEKAFDRQGKAVDATLPTYLQMALRDIDADAAEAFGLDNGKREAEGHMRGPPLMPQNCPSCGDRNRCYKEICEHCGTELPESKMPKNDITETEDSIEEILNEDIDINEIKKASEKLKDAGLI